MRRTPFREHASAWLAKVLEENGPMPFKPLAKLARTKGYSCREIWLACRRIGAALQTNGERGRRCYVLRMRSAGPVLIRQTDFVFVHKRGQPFMDNTVTAHLYRLRKKGFLPPGILGL
jgi:hypothetical protein